VKSLYELEEAVVGALDSIPMDRARSAYDFFVRSAAKNRGTSFSSGGTPAVEDAIEAQLASMSDEDLRELWRWTEGGQMAEAEGDDDIEPTRDTMLMDRSSEMLERITERICEGGEELAKQRRARRHRG
jgi:hypothetical protein